MVAEVGLDRAQQFKDSRIIDWFQHWVVNGKEGIDPISWSWPSIGSDNMGLGDTSDIMST